MSFDHANGGPPNPDQPDPAAMMRARMAMALRGVEEQFPGCAVSLFIADPANPLEFSYVSSAGPHAVRATLGAFLKEAK